MSWKKNLEKIYRVGSFVLIGWGVIRFLKGISCTTNVPNGDVFLEIEIPLSPYFMGYANGNLYMGAKTLGTIFFPWIELLWVFPMPVIWPIIFGGYLLWTGFSYPHRAKLKY